MRDHEPSAIAPATAASNVAKRRVHGPRRAGREPSRVGRHVEHQRELLGEAAEVDEGLGIDAVIGTDWRGRATVVVGGDQRPQPLPHPQGSERAPPA